MSFFQKHKRFFRFAFLLLFVLAILGPWTYTLDGVPPAEWCDEPFVLINAERCAGLVSGLTIFAWIPLLLVGLVSDLLTGLRSFWQVLFVIALLSLFVLPFLTGLPLLLRGDSRRRRRLHLAFLTLAAFLSAVLPFIMGRMDRQLDIPRFWGIWLYVAVAAFALSFELLIGRRTSRPRRPDSPAVAAN